MQLPAFDVPVVCAPMAGGPSTPELVAAVGAAGGLGFLAAGYRSTQDISAQITATRALGGHPFGVNVFVPAPTPTGTSLLADETAVAGYANRLAPEAARLRVRLPAPNWDDTDDWEAKLALLVADPVPVVSFTFGCPPPETVTALHEVGTAVLITVTDADEGRAAAAVGADGLVVQGFEAGAHRGTHRVGDVPNQFDHLALLPMLAGIGLPMIAAGGVTTAGDTARALAAGAVAVQAGTAFLLTPEAGTGLGHRMALSDPTLSSVITRVFSGRPARGLRNRFVAEHDGYAPSVFPAVDQLTKPLRAAAAREGDLGGLSLWAGSGWRATAEEPAADVVRRLTPPGTPTG